MLNLHQKEALLESVNNSIEAALSWGVTGLLYILGGMQIIEGRLSLGGVFAFISYSGYVTNPIMALLNLRIFFSTIIPSAKRLFQIFELEEEPDAGKLKMDQAPYLFSKTVRENIDLDSRTNQEAFLKACEKAAQINLL